MNIIVVSTRIFPDSGGIAKCAYTFSKFCSQRKINVNHITCMPRNIPFIREEKISDNFRINYMPFHAPEVNSNLFKLIIFFFKFFIYGIKKVIQINHRKRVDLIHVHSPPPSSFIGYTAFRLLKIPYFYSIHGLEAPIQYILKLDINLPAKNAKKTFIVSRGLEKFLKTHYDLNNLQWLPNGIEVSDYFHVKDEKEKENLIQNLKLDKILRKDDFIISYIGNMIFPQKVKGMIDFLNGFYDFLRNLSVKSEKEKIKLVYIGEGEYSYLLEDQIELLKLKKKVFLLGRRDDVKEILAISNFLPLTSYIEGFPFAILEAMASKVPCLGTNVGEIKFMIGGAGYLIKSGDIKGIRKKVEKYYKLSKLEQLKLMEKAYYRVKNLFDIRTIGEQLINFYFL